MSDEFKELEGQIEVRKEGTENILAMATQYVKTMGIYYSLYLFALISRWRKFMCGFMYLDKKKESIDKQKRLPIEGLALAMIQYGSDLHEDSAYGINYLFSIYQYIYH